MNASANTVIDTADNKVSCMSEFGDLPSSPQTPIFQVNPGVPATYIQTHAACLARGIRDVLRRADGDLAGDQVWMLWSSMDQLVALIDSMEFVCREEA
jgi:hypothetical protein